MFELISGEYTVEVDPNGILILCNKKLNASDSAKIVNLMKIDDTDLNDYLECPEGRSYPLGEMVFKMRYAISKDWNEHGKFITIDDVIVDNVTISGKVIPESTWPSLYRLAEDYLDEEILTDYKKEY